ncbi:Ger(x)C family spore germination protein [Paenibacillus qinlingensis]|uniref:Ger(X)C family germination protein n=1 Tax=Paenibacillus qinlingensis TaxID=1837343 RepID=A0ABU1NTA4_9BACL|nr:Ger(x)C family spore germination protein [Paenibacillus qinlingensis]MDR6550217.1 Ger(x)C family germination protein [Paenibacillus qinlingensis]
MKPQKLAVILLILIVLTTGCWDKKEINNLAIVDAIGIDYDPDTSKRIVYFQVVNPTGAGGKSGEAAKASVYTYKATQEIEAVSGFSIFANNQVPRIVFTNQVQVYIMTHRYALKYYREILDWTESNPTRRSTGFCLITDDPLDKIMNTVVPLDRIPGEAMQAMVDLQNKVNGSFVPVRARDAINFLSRKQPFIIPNVKLMNTKPSTHFSKLEEINAPASSVLISGGTVFLQDHNIGKIDDQTNNLNNVLNNKVDHFLLKIPHSQGNIEVFLGDTKVVRSLKIEGNKTKLQLEIKSSLRLMLDNRPMDPGDSFDYEEIEQLANKEFEKKCREFVQFAKEKNWDLLGIQDQIDRMHSKKWSIYKADTSTWKETDISLTVDLRVKWFGRIKSSYRREG